MSIPAPQFSVLDVKSRLLRCARTGFHSLSVMLAGPVKLIDDDIFRLMDDDEILLMKEEYTNKEIGYQSIYLSPSTSDARNDFLRQYVYMPSPLSRENILDAAIRYVQRSNNSPGNGN